jgi:hypothetical protein
LILSIRLPVFNACANFVVFIPCQQGSHFAAAAQLYLPMVAGCRFAQHWNP